MTKHLITLIILFSLMSLYKLHESYDDYDGFPDIDENDNDYDLNDEKYYENFNKTLKNYLIENGYFESDRLIDPPELKKIVFDVISEADPDIISENLKKIFTQLAEKFTDVYYNDNKQIRGRDIYGLINIDDIWAGFDDYLDLNSSGKYDFDDDDGEDDDLDVDNIFGADL